jgi:hypothetical protein
MITITQHYEEACELFEQERYKPAFIIFQRLARQGDTSCMIYLGIMYSDGKGVRRSWKLAIHWLYRLYFSSTASVERGMAACNLGCIYRDRSEYHLAVKWFRRSIEHGLVETWVELAKIYLHHLHHERLGRLYLGQVLRNKGILQITADSVEFAQRYLQ